MSQTCPHYMLSRPDQRLYNPHLDHHLAGGQDREEKLRHSSEYLLAGWSGDSGGLEQVELRCPQCWCNQYDHA